MNLLNFFKRKPRNPIDIELKKYKRKDRKRFKELYGEWEDGNFIKIEVK